MKKLLKTPKGLQWRVAALKNGLLDATAYRVEFFIEVLGSAFVPAAIQLVLWYGVFSFNPKASLGGLSHLELVQYTLTSILFSQIRGGNHDFDLHEMIRTGGLSQYLLRPVGVVEFIYIRGVASKLFLALLCLCVGILLSVWIPISPLRLCGAIGLALLGNIIHYQVGACLSTFAFLWEEAYSVLMVKNLLVTFLSGELIPLSLFPKNLEWIWKSTPFYLYVFGPSQYALGKWSQTEFMSALGLALLWIFVFWILIRVSWGLGIKRYQSHGG